MVPNFPSVFRAEIFRPLLVIFIPGALAIIPWILFVNATIPEVVDYRKQNEVVYYFGLLCAALSVGMILENLGSAIEVLVWDRRLERADRDFNSDWGKFLQQVYEHEPVGHRYLRSILLRMKFATHFALAVPVALSGTVAASVVLGWPSWSVVSTMLWVGSVMGAYLFWESYASCAVLARVRQLLVRGSTTAEHSNGKHATAVPRPAASGNGKRAPL